MKDIWFWQPVIDIPSFTLRTHCRHNSHMTVFSSRMTATTDIMDDNKSVQHESNGQRKQGHTYHNLYDVHSGRIRRRRNDYLSIECLNTVREPFSPDEFLMKRHARLLFYPYEEHPNLPSSELVTAIHYYMSQKCQVLGRQDLMQAFDETALLAIAIELEEKIKNNLGPNGHLHFAEPEDRID